MNRPTSIKVAGTFLLAASILWILDFALISNIAFNRGLTATLENPRFIRLLLDWGFILAMTTWATVTSIGLFWFKAWARVSILALSVAAAYHFLGVAFVAPFLRYQGPQSGVWISMMGMVIAYFGCGGLAGLAMFQFGSQRMDRIFESTGAAFRTTGEAGGPSLPTGSQSRFRTDTPLSLRVIGAWMVLVVPLALYQYLAHLQTIVVPLPLLPLDFSLTTSSTTTYFVLMTAAAITLGLGLLRRKDWARRGTIAFCIFSIVSQVATALWSESMERVMRAIPNVGISHLQVVLWLGTLWAVVPPSAALFFLITRRTSPPRTPIGTGLSA